LSRRILLTGATGFVGRKILVSLQEEDVEIVLVVRTGTIHNVVSESKVLNIIETNDLFSEDATWWASSCVGIDTIIHAAWYAEPGKYLLSDKNINCLQGTLSMAGGAITSGVKRFVGVGTCFEYDLSKGFLSVSTELNPLTPYAASKASAYILLLQWFAQKEVEFAWCRLFYLFGDGEDSRRLKPYIKSMLRQNKVVNLSTGNQIRDFMDVSDAGRLISKVALNKSTGAMNICSGVPITIRQFSEKIAIKSGKTHLLQFGTRPNDRLDPPCVVGILTDEVKGYL